MRCTPPPHCSCSQPPQRHSTPPHNRCGRSSSWVDWLIAGFFINSITVKSIHMSPLLPAEVQGTVCEVLMVLEGKSVSLMGPVQENDSILEHNILYTKMKLIVLTTNIDISNTIVQLCCRIGLQSKTNGMEWTKSKFMVHWRNESIYCYQK